VYGVFEPGGSSQSRCGLLLGDIPDAERIDASYASDAAARQLTE
jgi:hypothetical protein